MNNILDNYVPFRFDDEIYVNEDECSITIKSHGTYFNLQKQEIADNKYLIEYLQTAKFGLDDELIKKWKNGADLSVLNEYCKVMFCDGFSYE